MQLRPVRRREIEGSNNAGLAFSRNTSALDSPSFQRLRRAEGRGDQFVTSVSRVQGPRERPWTTLNDALRVAVAPCDFSRFEDAPIPGSPSYSFIPRAALSVTTYTLIESSFKHTRNYKSYLLSRRKGRHARHSTCTTALCFIA